eukprot:124475_1
MEEWNKNRLYKHNKCFCQHCCVQSNICALCRDFREPINWIYFKQPPKLTCIQCKQSYHMKCLPIAKRAPNSWNVCTEIGDKFKCGEYLDFFTLLHKMKINTKHETLIRKKLVEYKYNANLKIIDHFCGFIYNKWQFFLQDCAEIELAEEVGVARIVDIFTDDTGNAWLLIQWYWYKNNFVYGKNSDSNRELLLADDINNDPLAVRVIQIGEIPKISKVKVFNTFEQYKNNHKQLLQLKQQKMKKINILKQNNQNNLCLKKHISSITFETAFWSNKSCNGDENNKKIYKMNYMDTYKMRMEMQNKICSENIHTIQKDKNTNNSKIIQTKRKGNHNYVNNNNNNNQYKKREIYNGNNNKNNKNNKKTIKLKLKRKRKYNHVNEKIKNNGNNNNQCKKRKINMNNSNAGNNNNNNNNQYKKREIYNGNNNKNNKNNKKTIKLKLKRKRKYNHVNEKIKNNGNNNNQCKKRKINMNNSNAGNNNNNNNNQIITVSCEKYNKLSE